MKLVALNNEEIPAEDALSALENILGTRLYASQALAKLDDMILATFESAWPQPEDGAIPPDAANTIAPMPATILHLHQLLIARKQASDDMGRSDEAALPVLRRVGFAL